MLLGETVVEREGGQVHRAVETAAQKLDAARANSALEAASVPGGDRYPTKRLLTPASWSASNSSRSLNDSSPSSSTTCA